MSRIDEAIKAQEKYCEEHNLPQFAPSDGRCSCGNNIYYRISVKQAGKRLVTGCPFCLKSYCE